VEAVGARRARLVRRTALALALGCCAVGLVAGAAVKLSRSPAAPQQRLAERGPKSTLSPAAQSAISAALGKQSTAFSARRTGDGYRLRGGGVTARLGARHVTLRTTGVSLSFGLAGLGRGARLGVPAQPTLGAHGNRVTLERDGVTEWYAAGPFGIEQGFTLSQRPAGSGGGLTLALRLAGGARAEQDAAGNVVLSQPGGKRLSYGALSAVDAGGRTLPASLHARGNVLELRVRDRGAVYPVVIDPLIQQGAKLVGSDLIGASEFGYEVALSADGNTALIGGPFDNDAIGGAWVFTRSGTTWTQQAKLTGFGESGAGAFGVCVALSADGNTALVGGPDDNGSLGAAWVFTRSGTVWSNQQKIAGSGASGAPGIGFNVALSADGDTALLGGPFDNGSRGAAWVWTRTGSTWTQQGAKLTAAGVTGTTGVGYSVALSADGNTAVLGGPGDSNNVGAAWVFTRSGASWTQQSGKLTGNGETGAGFFGVSVATTADGNTALIGADWDNHFVGSVFTFVRSGTTWSQQGGKITGSGESGEGLFGYDVALAGDGTSALIGGVDDNNGVGAAWLFYRNGTAWQQSGSKLTGSGEVGAGAFGTAVALSANGSTALSGGSDDKDLVGATWAFVTAAPGAPTGVSASAGLGSASVSFTPPLGPVGSYTVTSSPGNFTATGSSSPIVVNGLTPGVQYTFTVTATNIGGTGPASAASNAVTPFGLAGAPTAVTATPGDGFATVSFTAPASNGSPIQWYTVTSSDGQAASGTGSPIRVFGLTNGSSYTFTVTATNAAGTGPASSASSSVTPTGGSRPHDEAPAPTPRPDVPAPPDVPRIPPHGD
jgi:hypothetical protein